MPERFSCLAVGQNLGRSGQENADRAKILRPYFVEIDGHPGTYQAVKGRSIRFVARLVNISEYRLHRCH